MITARRVFFSPMDPVENGTRPDQIPLTWPLSSLGRLLRSYPGLSAHCLSLPAYGPVGFALRLAIAPAPDTCRFFQLPLPDG